ncbi:MAG: hypothetical protein IPJ27_15225 [Candidatus Accumulibacter sp.]|uniref:Uncharacterized protein n=1 Tax=Candidatus Accumulibacter proximus TaxID=2954385 RepID=A0A935Q114_9PROT|nr:hypothetical protein [Candidatus Accumulibacter proximus]
MHEAHPKLSELVVPRQFQLLHRLSFEKDKKANGTSTKVVESASNSANLASGPGIPAMLAPIA